LRVVLSEPGQLCPPIWSCTSRGLPCPRCCHRGGGLLPHLFTLTGEGSRWKMSRRFSSGLSPGCFAGGIFSVALSVTRLESTVKNDCATKTSPGVTRRDALTLQPQGRRGSACADSVSGLSSRPCRSRGSDQRSSGSPASFYYNANIFYRWALFLQQAGHRIAACASVKRKICWSSKQQNKPQERAFPFPI
jgi:hypothetical protein